MRAGERKWKGPRLGLVLCLFFLNCMYFTLLRTTAAVQGTARVRSIGQGGKQQGQALASAWALLNSTSYIKVCTSRKIQRKVYTSVSTSCQDGDRQLERVANITVGTTKKTSRVVRLMVTTHNAALRNKATSTTRLYLREEDQRLVL